MKRFRREDEFQSLEAELRESRPKPPRELVHFVYEQVNPRRIRTKLRVALAGGLTVAMLVALASLGGLGYASSVAKPAVGWVEIVKKAVSPPAKKKAAATHAKKAKSVNAAANKRVFAKQYAVTLCHRPPGNPSNAHTITVGSQAAANAHFRHGDTPGPCP